MESGFWSFKIDGFLVNYHESQLQFLFVEPASLHRRRESEVKVAGLFGLYPKRKESVDVRSWENGAHLAPAMARLPPRELLLQKIRDLQEARDHQDDDWSAVNENYLLPLSALIHSLLEPPNIWNR